MPSMTRSTAPVHQPAPRRRLSAHEDVPTWCDCCSCEAEPRWQAVADELEQTRAGEAAQQARPDAECE